MRNFSNLASGAQRNEIKKACEIAGDDRGVAQLEDILRLLEHVFKVEDSDHEFIAEVAGDYLNEVVR